MIMQFNMKLLSNIILYGTVEGNYCPEVYTRKLQHKLYEKTNAYRFKKENTDKYIIT